MGQAADPSAENAGGPTRARLRVRGRVQGVWFRGFTREQALRLGLVGFARNLPDGSVEVVAQGREDAVRQLLEACREGPASARVDDVTLEVEPPAADLSGFRVL
jgi:acylphosphatase